MTKKKSKKKDGRKQKGQKAAEQKQRVKKYKSEQQIKKKGKKPKKYQILNSFSLNYPQKLLKTTYLCGLSDQSQTVNLYPLTRNV